MLKLSYHEKRECFRDFLLFFTIKHLREGLSHAPIAVAQLHCGSAVFGTQHACYLYHFKNKQTYKHNNNNRHRHWFQQVSEKLIRLWRMSSSMLVVYTISYLCVIVITHMYITDRQTDMKTSQCTRYHQCLKKCTNYFIYKIIFSNL